MAWQQRRPSPRDSPGDEQYISGYGIALDICLTEIKLNGRFKILQDNPANFLLGMWYAI